MKVTKGKIDPSERFEVAIIYFTLIFIIFLVMVLTSYFQYESYQPSFKKKVNVTIPQDGKYLDELLYE